MLYIVFLYIHICPLYLPIFIVCTYIYVHACIPMLPTYMLMYIHTIQYYLRMYNIPVVCIPLLHTYVHMYALCVHTYCYIQCVLSTYGHSELLFV